MLFKTKGFIEPKGSKRDFEGGFKEWVDGWMGGWVDGWAEGWVGLRNGWMGGFKFVRGGEGEGGVWG